MELCIGDNIKRLRRQKGITQEALADQLHISAAAVSKWERNETLPDIGMVIPLASYFGVSTDEVLGLDAAKNDERIRDYLEESGRLAALGRSEARFDLIARAYEEFPNDWRIVEAYMWQLNYDPRCTGKYGNEIHKEELYRLCDRVLDDCPVEKTRYAALSILGGLYLADGEKDKALETARRFPDYWMTEGEELQHSFEPGSAEWLGQIHENIFDLTSLLLVKIRDSALNTPDTAPREQIKYLEKAVSLIRLIFDDGDYGFYNADLSDLYLWIANRYVMEDDPENALRNYELSFSHARAYDALPEKTRHISFLVRGKLFDKSKTNSDDGRNMVARQIGAFRSFGVCDKIKDTDRMKELMRRYQPLMGKRE